MIQQLQKNCPTNQRLNHLPFKFSKIKLKYMFQLNWFSDWKLTIVPDMMFFFVLNPQLSPITSFRRPVLTPKQTWLTWRMTVSPIPAETWPCAEFSLKNLQAIKVWTIGISEIVTLENTRLLTVVDLHGCKFVELCFLCVLGSTSMHLLLCFVFWWEEVGCKPSRVSRISCMWLEVQPSTWHVASICVDLEKKQAANVERITLIEDTVSKGALFTKKTQKVFHLKFENPSWCSFCLGLGYSDHQPAWLTSTWRRSQEMQIILDGEQHLVVLRLTGAVVLKQRFCTGFKAAGNRRLIIYSTRRLKCQLRNHPWSININCQLILLKIDPN